MRWFLGLVIVFLAGSLFRPAVAQDKYWVVLKDKKGVSFDPYQYFDAKAIARRQQQQLPISDETDKPINPAYFKAVKATVDSVSGQSRWLNAVACYAKPNQIAALRTLVFVREIIPFQNQAAQLAQFKNQNTSEAKFKTTLNAAEQKILTNQTASLGAATFKERQLNGKGIRIAILDAGFKSVDLNPAFQDMRNEKRLLKTWDFVKRQEYVYDYATHGTMVLSCIGGSLNGTAIGLATGAEFLLARTERMHRENFSEEENWLAAMEWADKNGADIINSSLGYTNDRYFRNQMDGHTAFVARAANLAARKGILVVNANGNDGDSDSWKILGTPADADSVLAVGGIDPDKLIHVRFSSYGPTSDKRMKPNVCAFGIVVAAGPNGFENTQGTSFASPLVAGFAACAWQAESNLTNMQLFHKIEEAGSLYPYFDYAHGFGVPQASNFLRKIKPEYPPSLAFEREGTTLKIKLIPVVTTDTLTAPESSVLPVNFAPKNYLYYHIANPKGFLDKYFVIEPTGNSEIAVINLEGLKPGTIIRAYYNGYMEIFAL